MENNQQQNNQNQQPQNSNENQSSTNSQKNENMVPQSRLNEEIQKKKDLQAQLDTFLKDKEENERKAKEQQGEFQNLYNQTLAELTPLKEQFSAYQEAFKTVLEVELKTVPDKFKSLIPPGDELSQLKWIKEAQVAGLFKVDNVTDFGNTGNNPNSNNATITKEQFQKMSYGERVALANENPTLYKKLANS